MNDYGSIAVEPGELVFPTYEYDLRDFVLDPTTDATINAMAAEGWRVASMQMINAARMVTADGRPELVAKVLVLFERVKR